MRTACILCQLSREINLQRVRVSHSSRIRLAVARAVHAIMHTIARAERLITHTLENAHRVFRVHRGTRHIETAVVCWRAGGFFARRVCARRVSPMQTPLASSQGSCALARASSRTVLPDERCASTHSPSNTLPRRGQRCPPTRDTGRCVESLEPLGAATSPLLR